MYVDTSSKVLNAFLKPHKLYSSAVEGNRVPTKTARMNTVLIYAARVIQRDPNIELSAFTFQSLAVRPFRGLVPYSNTVKVFYLHRDYAELLQVLSSY